MSSSSNTIARKPRLIVTSGIGSHCIEHCDVAALARAFGRLSEVSNFELRYSPKMARERIEHCDGGRVLRFEWRERFAGPPGTQYEAAFEWAPRLQWVEYAAYGVHGESLPIAALEALSRALGQPTPRWRLRLPYCGYGPVPGVRKHRAGRYFRKMGTLNERRLNAMTLKEEGEVPARPSRCGHNLPSSWDDFQRDPMRSWKYQTKGRKSWDRR